MLRALLRSLVFGLVLATGAVLTPASGQETAATPLPGGVAFDLKALSVVPEVFPAKELEVEGVETFFYAGPKLQGKPTRIFAYRGVPKPKAGEATRKVPGIVLIHGGGGTAFDRWVKLWNGRGYAAIAMDLCGCVPVGSYGKWERHENGGPPGCDASFGQLDSPVEDQWTYHAVSAVALGHTLLRAHPDVDSERIGMTGISWGGYMTSVVSGVDSRFRFAVPVYGCGFLGDNSAWLGRLEMIGPEKSALWLKQWDPSHYLPKAKMPFLWVNGTNDFAYPMDSWQKSYRLPEADRTLCLRIRMPHGHGAAGENPEEIHAFANQILTGGAPLPRIAKQGRTETELWCEFEAAQPIAKAELCFTSDSGAWKDRKWEAAAATLDAAGKRASAAIPAAATVAYLNLFDDRNCVVSMEHIELKPPAPVKQD